MLIYIVCFSFVTEGISWSLTPDFGLPHALSTNGSLLAVGTCAGTVQLLRYPHRFLALFLTLRLMELRYDNDEAIPLGVAETIEVSDKRVTHLSWSPWRISGPNQGMTPHPFFRC